VRLAALATVATAMAAAAALAIGGCGSTYRPDAAPSTSDASIDAETTPDGGLTDGGEGNACSADLQSDAKNCGRCGHDCLGGACGAGKCAAVALSVGEGAQFKHLLVTEQYVFAGTVAKLAGKPSGIWRVSKSGNAYEHYVDAKYPSGLARVGDTLYFVIDQPAENGNDTHGGLWSCPIAGASPCTPTLVAAASQAHAVESDRDRVFYTDNAAGKGLMVYVPPAPPTVFRPGFEERVDVSNDMYVDGEKVFVTTIGYTTPQHGNLLERDADGGLTTVFSYASPTANAGRVFGTPTSLFFSAYDYSVTTGGVVKRMPRGAGGGGDLGQAGDTKRPYGIYADADRVYWTNQGEGEPPVYQNGSVVTCEHAGCCTTPEVLWTGDHPTAIGGDADAVYFTTYAAGAIWKIAKP
jgi:hypothetical protein